VADGRPGHLEEVRQLAHAGLAAVVARDQAQQLKPHRVRSRYAAAAATVTTGLAASCCGDTAGDGDCFGGQLYEAADRAELPADAVDASLGCGNPLVVAELGEGETVLDLGSGGGIDVLLSARRVGDTGRPTAWT